MPALSRSLCSTWLNSCARGTSRWSVDRAGKSVTARRITGAPRLMPVSSQSWLRLTRSARKTRGKATTIASEKNRRRRNFILEKPPAKGSLARCDPATGPLADTDRADGAWLKAKALRLGGRSNLARSSGLFFLNHPEAQGLVLAPKVKIEFHRDLAFGIIRGQRTRRI